MAASNTGMTSRLRFLKLGGSLITEKGRPHTARPEALARLAGEIAAARRADPDLALLLGHGSGSFGHVPASRYGTRQGVHSPEEWAGFGEVWREAAALNHLVMQALAGAGLPALVFPPSACVLAEAGRPQAWNLEPLQAALDAGLVPVVYGDVVFDRARGGTILSTEDVFAYLAPRLHPARILLAGLEAGVWGDYPARTHLLAEITPASFKAQAQGVGASAAVDVTGGMRTKVAGSLDLLQAVPGADVLIFSGETPGNLARALQGEILGTRLFRP